MKRVDGARRLTVFSPGGSDDCVAEIVTLTRCWHGDGALGRSRSARNHTVDDGCLRSEARVRTHRCGASAAETSCADRRA